MMEPRRLHKTLVDYMVIAISPALIMLLVGSLCFFLLTALYHGEHHFRLSWVFGFFILGAVMVGRLSIEEGKEYAMLFALPLAAAVSVAVMVEEPGVVDERVISCHQLVYTAPGELDPAFLVGIHL